MVGPFAPGDAPLEGLVDALAAITPDMHFDPAAEVAAYALTPHGWRRG